MERPIVGMRTNGSRLLDKVAGALLSMLSDADQEERRERRKEMFFFTTLLMDHFSHLISVFLGRKDKFLEIFLSTSDIGVNIVYKHRKRSFISFLSSLNLSIRLLYIHLKMEGVNKIFCLFY